MKRRSFLALPALGWLALSHHDTWVVPVQAAENPPLNGPEREATLRFIQSLRNEDGGFRITAEPAPSNLGAVVSGTRAYKYLVAPFPDPATAIAYAGRCFDGTAFGETPGGLVSVRATAMGAMALAELGLAKDSRVTTAAKYLAEKPTTIPEIYIAAAALDAAKLPIPSAARWTQALDALRNVDGSYGKGAYDTATAIATYLRLGKPARDWSRAVVALRAGQRPDGGFAEMGDESDMASTYRVVRAFRAVQEKPRMDALRGFIRRCRNEDGGYGPQPGKASTLPATYNAAIVLHWLDELAA